jgi:hypothetical protein
VLGLRRELKPGDSAQALLCLQSTPGGNGSFIRACSGGSVPIIEDSELGKGPEALFPITRAHHAIILHNTLYDGLSGGPSDSRVGEACRALSLTARLPRCSRNGHLFYYQHGSAEPSLRAGQSQRIEAPSNVIGGLTRRACPQSVTSIVGDRSSDVSGANSGVV